MIKPVQDNGQQRTFGFWTGLWKISVNLSQHRKQQEPGLYSLGMQVCWNGGPENMLEWFRQWRSEGLRLGRALLKPRQLKWGLWVSSQSEEASHTFERVAAASCWAVTACVVGRQLWKPRPKEGEKTCRGQTSQRPTALQRTISFHLWNGETMQGDLAWCNGMGSFRADIFMAVFHLMTSFI